jgi:hypothetical protein
VAVAGTVPAAGEPPDVVSWVSATADSGNSGRRVVESPDALSVVPSTATRPLHAATGPVSLTPSPRPLDVESGCVGVRTGADAR